MTVFLATLGQRPEAITMALDRLLPRYHYEEAVILHTDPARSDIATAYQQLMDVLPAMYPEVKVRGCDLGFDSKTPLLDIVDQHSAEAYYRALLEVLRQYRVRYTPIHLLIAGGRKAMSIYATLAAALLFGEHDRVWTILTPPDLMRPGLFHVPPGQRDAIKLVQLPVNPSRLLPGMIAAQNVDNLLSQARISPRQQFIDALTEEERNLAELYRQHPYASNAELGALLQKSPKTIENQFGSIYDKMFSYFDLNIDDKHKRQALLDILAGRV